MPELPEVETTARGLTTHIAGLRIDDLWTDYRSAFHVGKKTIKNPAYLKTFRAAVIGKRILGARRRAKYVLLDLEGGLTMVIHMKMTGHFLYGSFIHIPKNKSRGTPDIWTARGNANDDELNDPFNRHVRLVFTLDNGKHLAFSDMRRFATITLFNTEKEMGEAFASIGPEPFDATLTPAVLAKRLQRKVRTPIKQALLDQTVVAGIGNIYGDEILWHAGIHPATPAASLDRTALASILRHARAILAFSISVGGDSMSDFRTIEGKRGGFHPFHKAYRQTGKRCQRKGCSGTICRTVIGARSAHFCSVHQKGVLRKASKR